MRADAGAVFRGAALLGVTVAGGALRARHLSGYQGLSGDEAFTLALAQRPFGHMLSLFHWEGNGVLYPLIAWPLVRLSDSVGMLRLPALVAGTAAIPALYWTGRRLAGWMAALTAASLLAFSPLAIAYSQIARPYTFALLFGIASFGCLDRALAERSSRTWWVLYVAATAAALYTNALAITLLLPQAVLVLRYSPRARAWRRSLVALALASTPLATLLIWERGRRDPLYWLDPPSLQTLRRTATQLAVSRPGLWLTILFVLIAATTGALRRRREENMAGIATIAAWAIAPALAIYIASHTLTPLFWIGYLLPMLPGLLLLVGVAAERSPAPIAAVAVVGLLIISARSSIVYAGDFHPIGWQQASAALARERQVGDPVVFDIPDGLAPAGYYDAAFAGSHHRIIVSEWHDEPLPASAILIDDPGGYGDAQTGPPTKAQIERLAQKTGRVFLMLYEINRQGASKDWRGIRWARAHCKLGKTSFGDEIEMIAISDCRTD